MDRTDWKSDAYVVSDWGAVELAFTAQNYSTSLENAVADSIYVLFRLKVFSLGFRREGN